MTRDELARHDGQEGRRALVAVSGKIYDLTGSPLWLGGDHEGNHRAGADLTAELAKAPHVRAVIERFPVVGQLESLSPVPARKGLGLAALALGIAVAALLFWLLR